MQIMKNIVYINKSKLIILSIIFIFSISLLAGLFAQDFPISLGEIFKSNANKISPKKGAEDLQISMRKIAKERTPAVVHIKVTIELDPAVAEYYGLPVENEVSGTGFIVSTEGYVITNYHVVQEAVSIVVKMWNGEEFYAGLIGADPKTDIALLRFQTNGRKVATLPLGDSDDLKVGDLVFAIGNPWGLSGSMTMGIVSATGRTDQLIEEEAILKNYIQSDVAINQGNSGGPLLNLKGEVVAMNSALLTAGGGWDGVSFSIPINVVKRIIKDLADDGIVERGYLGVVFKALDKDLAEYFGIDSNMGVIVIEVIEDSPADKGGIEVGDVILEYNDEEINTLNKLLNQVLATPIDEEIPVKVLREGEGEKILKVIIKKKPKDINKKKELTVNNFGTAVWLGMELGNYEQFSDKIIFDGDGLVVVNINERSNAYGKGIMPGDIIVSVNDEPIMDLQQLDEYAETEGKLFMLKIYRNGRYDIVAVRGE